MAGLSKKLLEAVRKGEVRGLLKAINDPDTAPDERPFFHHQDVDVPEQFERDVRGTYDALMHANARVRLALRIVEVATQFHAFPPSVARKVRAHLNGAAKELVRALPDSLCESCYAVDERRRKCKLCSGKGYHSLGDLKLV